MRTQLLIVFLTLGFIQAQNRLDSWQVIGPGGGGAQFNPTISSVNGNLVLVNCDMTGSYISEDGGNTWRMFNLRGVVHFFVPDPVDSKIIYAATENLYRSKDTGKTWELVYPRPNEVAHVVNSGDHAEARVITRSGEQTRVEALAVDPADSRSLFAVISKNKKSALYHSSDFARTWEALGDVSTIERIYVDPASPKQNRSLYLAGYNSVTAFANGIIHKQNGPAGVERFLDIAAGFSGTHEKPTFYAVSGIDWRGGETGVTGLFTSTDGGATWRNIPVDFLSNAQSVTSGLELRAVGTSLNHPETAYLSFNDHRGTMGVAKTIDRGKTWHFVWRDTKSTAALNLQDPWIVARFGSGWGENPFAFGVSPTDANICFATDFGRTTRTRDGGKTWQGIYARKLQNGRTTTTGLDVLTVHGIQMDPFDPDHWLVDFTDIGLFESRKGGSSWKERSSQGVPKDWENTTYWTVFDPAVKGRVWAVMSGTHDLPRPKMWRRAGVKDYMGGVVVSDDGGDTWKPSSEGMPQTAATHILLDVSSPIDRRTLYVCGFGKGIYKSIDGGHHWSLKNAGLEGAEPFAFRLVQDSKASLYLVVARRGEDAAPGTALDGALYRSDDGAEHWQKLSLPAGCNGPNGLAIDPQDPKRLYLAAWGRATGGLADSGGGIFVSTDAGQTWNIVLRKDEHVFDITIDPTNPNVLYATGFESSVWKSTDKAEHWARVKGYNFKWGQRVITDPKNPGMIYVCTFGGAIWHGPTDLDSGEDADIITPVMMPDR